MVSNFDGQTILYNFFFLYFADGKLLISGLRQQICVTRIGFFYSVHIQKKFRFEAHFQICFGQAFQFSQKCL